MDDEVKNEENEQEETIEETNEDNREEETKDEIRDNDYVNDDEIQMLKSIEKRFNALEDKLDNMISMYVDSGAIIQDSFDSTDEAEKDSYDDDFIDLDKMDLKL